MCRGPPVCGVEQLQNGVNPVSKIPLNYQWAYSSWFEDYLVKNHRKLKISAININVNSYQNQPLNKSKLFINLQLKSGKNLIRYLPPTAHMKRARIFKRGMAINLKTELRSKRGTMLRGKGGISKSWTNEQGRRYFQNLPLSLAVITKVLMQKMLPISMT